MKVVPYSTVQLLLAWSSFVVIHSLDKKGFLQLRHRHKVLPESLSRLHTTISDSPAAISEFNQDLHKILRVRVPGTIGHSEVRQFLVNSLEQSGWNVKLDSFKMDSPLGEKIFTNIIATLDDDSDKHLALVAHYDSKLMEPVNSKYFLAATDSAVPVAMLLEAARYIAKETKEHSQHKLMISPKIILLDGEEAFVEWNAADSIYGARHLADLWHRTPHQNPVYARSAINQLDRLEAFVLLDLIGEARGKFYNLHQNTAYLYDHMQTIERKHSNCSTLFPGVFKGGPVGIEDDHTPFLRKGVPILHLISIPFPKAWHKLEDDLEHLDFPTIHCIRKILRIFLLEYFHLGTD